MRNFDFWRLNKSGKRKNIVSFSLVAHTICYWDTPKHNVYEKSYFDRIEIWHRMISSLENVFERIRYKRVQVFNYRINYKQDQRSTAVPWCPQ